MGDTDALGRSVLPSCVLTIRRCSSRKPAKIYLGGILHLALRAFLFFSCLQRVNVVELLRIFRGRVSSFFTQPGSGVEQSGTAESERERARGKRKSRCFRASRKFEPSLLKGRRFFLRRLLSFLAVRTLLSWRDREVI